VGIKKVFGSLRTTHDFCLILMVFWFRTNEYEYSDRSNLSMCYAERNFNNLDVFFKSEKVHLFKHSNLIYTCELVSKLVSNGPQSSQYYHASDTGEELGDNEIFFGRKKVDTKRADKAVSDRMLIGGLMLYFVREIFPRGERC